VANDDQLQNTSPDPDEEVVVPDIDEPDIDELEEEEDTPEDILN
jgi:CHASE2 domain-containing sensor protein